MGIRPEDLTRCGIEEAEQMYSEIFGTVLEDGLEAEGLIALWITGFLAGVMYGVDRAADASGSGPGSGMTE